MLHNCTTTTQRQCYMQSIANELEIPVTQSSEIWTNTNSRTKTQPHPQKPMETCRNPNNSTEFPNCEIVVCVCAQRIVRLRDRNYVRMCGGVPRWRRPDYTHGVTVVCLLADATSDAN